MQQRLAVPMFFCELISTQRQVKGAVSKFDFIPHIGTIGNGIIVPNEQKVVAYADWQITILLIVK